MLGTAGNEYAARSGVGAVAALAILVHPALLGLRMLHRGPDQALGSGAPQSDAAHPCYGQGACVGLSGVHVCSGSDKRLNVAMLFMPWARGAVIGEHDEPTIPGGITSPIITARRGHTRQQ